MGIVIPLLVISFACLLIWRACDGFEVASKYIGRNLSEGVRGGTINAVASSVPELFTTLIALLVLSDQDGFSVGIGTTAGSALFNGMVIPALCIFGVVGTVVAGKRVMSVNVMPKVLLRDGLSLIFCEVMLLVCINGTSLHWWQGAILMGLYTAYLGYTLFSMKSNAGSAGADRNTGFVVADKEEAEPMGAAGRVFYWLSLGPLLDLEGMFVKEKQREQMRNGTWNGWPLLLASTAAIGFACLFLVHGCEWIGADTYVLLGQEFSGLDMPTMFVAVIFASMATSVPDMVISIRDARDGDSDDAVANALGSNIFDICFALGFPLFLYTIFYGPITMSEEIANQSAELRILLLIFTIIGFFIYFVGKRVEGANGQQLIAMGKGKAFSLLAIYTLFVAYIVGLGAGEEWANSISSGLRVIAEMIPTLT